MSIKKIKRRLDKIKLPIYNLFCSIRRNFSQTIKENIVVIDSTFPLKDPFGPRNSEITELFKVIPEFSSYTMYPMKPDRKAWFRHGYGVEENIFKENKAGYLQFHPENSAYLKYLKPYLKYNFKLAYSYFLAETYTLLPFLNRNTIPFIFVLFPGGAFGINNESSDNMLKKIFKSKYFRKVIVTQKFVYNYLIDSKLCEEKDIHYCFTGTVMFKNEDVKTKKLYKKDKDTFDICFVAAKYTDKGIDKGYDLFIETAIKAAKFNEDIRFHVIGGFDENEIDVSEIKDKIKFYGYKKPNELPLFYQNMDIFLSPDRPFKMYKGNFHGFPLSAGAMFCGVCGFNADDLGLNTEYKDDEIVIIKTNSDDIVEKIKYYFEHLEELYNISQKGQFKTQELFDLNKLVNDRKELFYKILGEHYSE